MQLRVDPVLCRLPAPLSYLRIVQAAQTTARILARAEIVPDISAAPQAKLSYVPVYALECSINAT